MFYINLFQPIPNAFDANMQNGGGKKALLWTEASMWCPAQVVLESVRTQMNTQTGSFWRPHSLFTLMFVFRLRY